MATAVNLANGHCGKIGNGPSATAWNEAVQEKSVTIYFCAVGRSAGFGYSLWVTGQDCVELHRTWLCGMDHSTGYGYALWASVAKNCMYINSTVQGLRHPCFKPWH